jgi:quinol-cytochrome oxidoreductase complex cytochrome b subunit
MRPSFFHHLHPPTIPADQSRFRYTLGAGGLSVFLILVLIISGALLMFYYTPTPQDAGASIQTITFLVPYGAILRNLHYWAAQFLIVISLIHLLRVILTSAYTPPRRFNYLLGLSLLILCLFLDFTGYVLRWDEGVRWALVAGTNLIKSIPLLGPPLYILVMGGDQPGAASLIRLYAWHIFGLSFILVALGVWHIFKVRRDGGIAVPPPDMRRNHARIPRVELVRREGLAALIGMGVLLLISAFLQAPLAAPIVTVTSPGSQLVDARAPWFFLWVQQLLKFGNPFFMGVLLPLFTLVFLALIPYLLPKPPLEELGRWFPPGARLSQILVLLLTCTLLGLTAWAVFP